MASILDLLDSPDQDVDAWWASFEEEDEDDKEPAPAEVPDRGVLSDVAVSVGRGLAGIPELLLRGGAGAFELARETDPARRAMPVDRELAERVQPLDRTVDVAEILRGAGEDVGQWRDETMPLSRQTLESDPEAFLSRRSLTQGIESGVTSLGVKLPAAFVGFVLGGPAGAAAGYLSGAPAFGAAQYDEARQAYLKKGLPEKEAHFAALLEGASEWGFEEFTDLLQLVTLGAGTPLSFTAKQALKQSAVKLLQRPLATAAKKGAVIAGTETVGELLNAGVQNEVQRLHGLHDTKFWSALHQSLGPVAVSSMIFGTLGAGVNLAQQYEIKQLLTNPEPAGMTPEAAAQHRARREAAAKQVADALARVAPAAAIEFRRGAQVAIDTGAALPAEIDLEARRERTAAAEAPPADAGSAHKIVEDQEQDEHGRPRAGTDLVGGLRQAPTRTTPSTAPAAGPDLSTPEGRQAAIEAIWQAEEEPPAAPAAPDLRQILLGRPTSGRIGPQPDPIQQTREQMRGQLRQTPWERAQETRRSQREREAALEARLPELAVEARRQLAEAARWGITLPKNERKRLEAIVARAEQRERRLAAEAAARAPRPVEPLRPADLGTILGQGWPMTPTPPMSRPTPVDWQQVARQAGVAEPAPPPTAEPAAPPTPVDWAAVARQAGIAEEPRAPQAVDVDPIFVEMAQRAGLKVEDLFPAGTRLNLGKGGERAQAVGAKAGEAGRGEGTERRGQGPVHVRDDGERDRLAAQAAAAAAAPQAVATPQAPPAVSTPGAAGPAPMATLPATPPPAARQAAGGRQAPVRQVASGAARTQEAAPAEPAAQGVVGKNAEGDEIRADAKGARYLEKDGVRLTQAVRMVPGRGAVIPGPRELFEQGKTEFLTAEELAAFRVEKEGDKGPQPAAPAEQPPGPAKKEAPEGPTVQVTRIEADGRKVKVGVPMEEARRELEENRIIIKRLKSLLECL